jgi:hypothetical protein
VLQKLVGRFRSDLACSAAGNKDATPTLRYGWRLIHECVEAVAGNFGLKQAYESFSVHEVSVEEKMREPDCIKFNCGVADCCLDYGTRPAAFKVTSTSARCS